MAKRGSSKSHEDPPKVTGLPLGPGSRVVLLKGKDEFVRELYTGGLKKQLTKAFGGIDTFQFDGEKDLPADILDECRSFGLMSSHKLVVVDQAELLVREGGRVPVERYAESPCDGATLVLRAGTWHPGKLDQLIEKIGTVVLCEAPEPADAVRWVRSRAKNRHGADLPEPAAWLLVDRYGADLGRLASELGKLAVVARPGPEGGRVVITEDLVADLCGGTREIDPWSVQGQMLSGRAEQTIGAVRRVLEASARDTHVPVAMACAHLAADLHAIAASGDERAVGRARRIFGDRVGVLARAAGRSDAASLGDLLRAAIETDAMGKSGVGEPSTNLEILALRFAQTLR